jgi:hypothetical protein
VETVVLEPGLGEAFGGGRVDRPTKGARGREPDVVEQDDQEVRSLRRRPKRLDRREGRVPRVERKVSLVLLIWDRKDIAPLDTITHRSISLLTASTRPIASADRLREVWWGYAK